LIAVLTFFVQSSDNESNLVTFFA